MFSLFKSFSRIIPQNQFLLSTNPLFTNFVFPQVRCFATGKTGKLKTNSGIKQRFRTLLNPDGTIKFKFKHAWAHHKNFYKSRQNLSRKKRPGFIEQGGYFRKLKKLMPYFKKRYE